MFTVALCVCAGFTPSANLQGKWDLTDLASPPCMDNLSFMGAPECFHERKRNAEVQLYLQLEHWENDEALHQLTKHMRTTMKAVGLGISLIKRTKVIFKYEKRLNLRELPRSVLIDSHCILSNKPFVLLDTRQDWRTRNNPLVTGSPYIRFYCGVHLKSPGNQIVGVLSIFDTRPRTEFPQESIDMLTQYALEVMTFLHAPYDTIKDKGSNERRGRGHAHADVEQMQKKLGRATSRGNNLTLFERDGSGSAYTSNLSAADFFQSKCVVENTLASTEKHKIIKQLYDVNSMNDGSALICNSIKTSENVDIVGIYEVKMTSVYALPFECIPLQQTLTREMVQNVEKDAKARPIQNFQVRLLGLSAGTNVPIVYQYLKSAFDSDYGIQYAYPTNTATFNRGVFMTFLSSEPRLVTKTEQSSKKGVCEACIRSNGFIIFALNKSVTSKFSQQKVSRIFDYARIMREICAS